MLTIRLKRIGKKHQPSFRVIVTPQRAGGPDGKPVEELGWVNPLMHTFSLDKERIAYWMQQGAKPSATLHNLLVKAGVISKAKIAKHNKVAAHAEPAAPAAEAPAGQKSEEAPKTE